MCRLAVLIAFSSGVLVGCGKADRPADSPPEAARPDGVPGAASAAAPAGPAELGQWSRAGAVEARVTKAAVQKIPLLKNTGPAESREPALVVWVEVRNRSAAAVEYRQWHATDPADPAPVTDDLGNRYRLRVHLAAVVVGETRVAALPPGGPAVADVLCFEPPAAGATALTLRLSARGGANGEHVFRIPAPAWKK